MESFGAGVLRGQMVRLRNRVKILKYEVLELCCSEWFQNLSQLTLLQTDSFRAVLLLNSNQMIMSQI